ncbi:MAG: rRNA maturation RNase YbeY [Chloroflexi bacterium]|nr:rRNA maturation RNase YbeY [Chloroflexota bacterium]
MSKLKLSFRIEKQFTAPVSRERLRKAVALTLSHAVIDKAVELGLVIASDKTVRDLNRKYRKIDSTTDVLAFALTEATAKGTRTFAAPPDNTIHLGEIIISYPRAKRQAEEQKHSIERELALLVAHGVLHLLGYDHIQAKDAKKMRDLEARVLDKIENTG